MPWARSAGLRQGSACRTVAVMNRSLALVTAMFLGGCGDHLGTYQVDGVELADRLPSVALDGKASPPHPQLLRVAFSSPFNLHASETGAGLYIEADTSPLRDPYRLVTFGPVVADGRPVENWRRETPLRPAADGRFHYLAWLAVRSPSRKRSGIAGDTIPAANLAEGRDDLCLRLFVPGYAVTTSQSDVFRVERRLLDPLFGVLSAAVGKAA